MPDLLAFNGRIDDQNQTHLSLSAATGGRIGVPKDAVVIRNQTIYIRKGTTIKLINSPMKTVTSLFSNDDSEIAARTNSDCPGGNTMCIGLIEICCRDFRIIGPCIGIWGC